jgi:flavin-dependent dehydrogenase
MTGEGIAQALETGELAAGAIARGGDVAGRYRRAVRRRLAVDLRFAGLLQRVLAWPWGARGAIRAVDQSDWTRRQFARWMFEDYPRGLLLTPSRWQRGALTGAGRAPW